MFSDQRWGNGVSNLSEVTLRLRCVKQRNRSAAYYPEAILRSTCSSKWKGGYGLDRLLIGAGGPILWALTY
jgi:hypothetical protein